MKVKREIAIGVIVVLTAIVCVVYYNRYQRSQNHRILAERMNAGVENPVQSIEDLKKSISIYEKKVEQHVKDSAQTALYWKLLTIRLQDRGLYNESLNAAERALYYTPNDPVLHYQAGVSAAMAAKNTHNFTGTGNPERERLYRLAEESFIRAVEIDEKYLKPAYSLGVLYTYDLNRPLDAIPVLERCLEISKNDADTMFVLAGAYYLTNFYNKAVEMYDRIIKTTKDPQKKRSAEENRQLVIGMSYG